MLKPSDLFFDDFDYEAADTSVRRLARWLRSKQFDVIDAYSPSRVVIREPVPESLVPETVRLHELLERAGVAALFDHAPDGVPLITSIYDHASKTSTITIAGLTDLQLPEWVDRDESMFLVPSETCTFEEVVLEILDKVFDDETITASFFACEPRHRQPGERTQRFLEEALELAQATGSVSVEQVHRLVDYVFQRPVGDVTQELGGAYVSLRALAAVLQRDAGKLGLNELKRIQLPEVQERIRRRQVEKNAALGS